MEAEVTDLIKYTFHCETIKEGPGIKWNYMKICQDTVKTELRGKVIVINACIIKRNIIKSMT